MIPINRVCARVRAIDPARGIGLSFFGHGADGVKNETKQSVFHGSLPKGLTVAEELQWKTNVARSLLFQESSLPGWPRFISLNDAKATLRKMLKPAT
jgi:hypothetical protein